jgi:multiple sugar transport system permease protein
MKRRFTASCAFKGGQSMQAGLQKQKGSFLHNENVVGYLFAAPFIISFLCLTLIPMALSLYYSFCNYKIAAIPEWTGLQNYANLLKDETFRNSLLVTIQYVVIGVPLKLVFALLVAMLLTRPTKLQGFYRAVYYIPSLIGGSVAVALVWKQLFGSRGPVVSLIKTLGVPNFNFFGSTTWAFLPLVLCNAWQFGSSMLIFASGLKQIPKDYYEAAAIDGAGYFARFRHVTFPQLAPLMVINFVGAFIAAFQGMGSIFLLTFGGPGDATQVLSLQIWKEAYSNLRFSTATTTAWYLGIALVGFTYLQIRFLRRVEFRRAAVN